MNIKRKLALSTALSVLFLFMMAVAGWLGYRSVTNTAATVNAFEKEMFYVQMVFRGVNESILTDGTSYSVDIAKKGVSGFENTHKTLLAKLRDPELEDALNRKIGPKWQIVKEGIEPFLRINAVSADDENLMTEYGELLSVGASLEEEIRSAIGHIQLDSALSVKRTQYAIAVIVLALLVTMSLLQLDLYRTIAIPINKLRTLMKDISEGKEGWEERLNLKSEVISRSFDGKNGWFATRVEDIQTLAAAFNGMIQKIASYIEERKQTEKEILYRAHHDNLTRLPNRLLLMDHLNQAITRMQRQGLFAAVLFLDLDRFKFVNDTMGHAMGDSLLKIVANKLEDCVRQSDTVARIGGDEFVILLTDIEKKEDIIKTTKRIFSAFDTPINLQGNSLFISASIGISVYPEDGENAETLLKNADIAMYKAKNEGRNSCRYYAANMNASSMIRFALEQKLHVAMEKEQFLLYYLPEADIVTGEVTGMEALIRWQEPEAGLLLPGEFIPMAEDTGLIIPLGEWVLRTACAQNKAWQDNGLKNLKVSVNVSMRQFRQKNFIDVVRNVLKETGLDPGRLELELSESIIMDDTEGALKTLVALSEMGVRLAIDDFGTGFSSISFLGQIPANQLKIDRSFVRDITSSRNAEVICDAIIRMGESLKISVVAEGVETAEQLQLLQRLHCNRIQGYLVSKPLPSKDVEEFLKKGAAANA